MKNYEVIRVNENTWSIEDVMVRFFLLVGQEKALLIDSGLDIENVKALAQYLIRESAEGGSLAEVPAGEKIALSEDAVLEADAKADGPLLPLELLNTHADGDHCFGNKEFDWCYMHDADIPHYRKQFGETGDIVSVKDGEIIDLGGRPLELVHIPGHTFGSIAVIDVVNRALFSGDSVQDGKIFMFGEHRDLDEYPASLMKLQDMEEKFDVVYASHGTLALEADTVGDCFDACESMMHGEVEPVDEDIFGHKIHAYNCGVTTFLIGPDQQFIAPEED